MRHAKAEGGTQRDQHGREGGSEGRKDEKDGW